MRDQSGNNFLLQSAMPILVLMITLKKATTSINIECLHEKIVTQIANFEHRAKFNQYSKQEISAARYCLLAALDEIIMQTNWGKNSAWTQKTLVSMFYGELDSGNKFYIILDNFLHEQRQNEHLLELIYFILSFGFVGKYHGQEHKINNIRENIFNVIATYKSKRLLEDNTNKNIIKKKQPIKIFLLGSLITALIFWLTTIVVLEKKLWQEQEMLFSLLAKSNN